jgi:hypothetical protein|tara:strand:- start:2878 stop:4035 length:1158 start_codon:yes stop_codon:yes gene_type:complete
MASACVISPLSAFLSTNLNNKIDTYARLGDRVKRALGYPLVSVEVHPDQMNENIQIGVEYFTKYAGYTREYMIFDSALYESNKGIRLDMLYTLANSDMDTVDKQVAGTNPLGPGIEFYGVTPDIIYVAQTDILSSVFASQSALSATFSTGIEPGELFDHSLVANITAVDNSLDHLSAFKPNIRRTLTQEGSASDITQYQNVYDYDVMDYRKVVDVTDFEEGSNTGINTLFTLEQTLAQQTYFSYAMGNYGFDLVSWYTMKEWIDTREKVLALRKDLQFDPRTQYLKMYPQPRNERFYGVISCYVERPIRDVIKEQWVYEYALALTMITVGRVRGKFGNVNLLGGGALNYDLLQEGVQKKAELETKLLEGASPGLGDTDPALFIVG